MAVNINFGTKNATLFHGKDVRDMLPFAQDSVWNFSANEMNTRTTMPTVTGTSVLGIIFDKGVMICADTLASYGSLARFTNVDRVLKVNDKIILGVGGDLADCQFLTSVIKQQIIDEECLDDGFNLKPRSLHCWLTRTLYNKRSKFEPLWTSFIIGGMQDDKPFLGFVDKIGTAYQAPTMATGFGAYLAQPVLAKAYEEKPLNEKEAQQVLVQCMRTLYCRDARSLPKFTLAVATAEGSRVEGPFMLDANWVSGYLVQGYE